MKVGKTEREFSFQRSHNKEIIKWCWFGAQETFIVIINVKNTCAAYYVVEIA